MTELTPAEQEQCDLLYEELKPEAIHSARAYVLARTPAVMQDAMNAHIDADFPPPPPVEGGVMSEPLSENAIGQLAAQRAAAAAADAKKDEVRAELNPAPVEPPPPAPAPVA